MLAYVWGVVSNVGSAVYHSGGVVWVLGSATISGVLAGVSLVRGNYAEASLSAAGAVLTLRDELPAVVTILSGGIPTIPLVVRQDSTSHVSRVITHTGLAAGNAVGLGVELGGMVYNGAAIIFHAVYQPASSEEVPPIPAQNTRALRALTY